MTTQASRTARWSVVAIGLLTCLMSSAWAQDLKIATWNIRWYGAEELQNNEFRDKYIRSYLNRELGDADVIVFQEIVDVPRLKKNIVDKDMYCQSYNGGSGHQHVVICWRKPLRFVKQPDDSNFEIESMKNIGGKARPGMYGVLTDKDGVPLAHIIGVHLKAFPHETSKRIIQAHKLSDRVKKLKYDVPVIITGDYNTHLSENTGYDLDDSLIIDHIFKEHKLGLFHVPNRFKYTFKNANEGRVFDHFWVSNSVQVKEALNVSSPCRSRSSGDGFDDLEYYNYYVSDHCPVQVTLGLGR